MIYGGMAESARCIRADGVRENSEGELRLELICHFTSSSPSAPIKMRRQQLTNQSTQWSRVLLAKPTDPWLAKRNLTVHYRVHKCPLLVPTLNHVRTVPTLPPYLAHLISISIPSNENTLLKVISTLCIFRPKLCMRSSALPCVLHSPAILSTLIS